MALHILISGKPKIFMASADLTNNGRLSEPSFGAEVLDVTTFNDTARRAETGLRTISYRYNGFFDDASQKSHTALNDMLTNRRVVSIYPMGDAASATGVGLGSALVTNYTPGGSVGGVLELGANIDQEGTWEMLRSVHTITTYTANGTSASVNNGSATTGGGAFYVHVFSHSGTAFTANLQDSADDVSFANITGGTAAIASGTVLGTRITFTGTLRQYHRVTYIQDGTAATGTWSAQSGVVRGTG